MLTVFLLLCKNFENFRLRSRLPVVSYVIVLDKSEQIQILLRPIACQAIITLASPRP